MEKNILQQETLSHKLISKWFWAYVFVVFTAPLGYLIRLLASNTLSVADVWIFYGVLSLITLLYSYNDLGLTESMQYFLPKYWIEWKKWQIKNTIWLSFFMQFVTWIIIFSLLFFNAEWLAINHFHEIGLEIDNFVMRWLLVLFAQEFTIDVAVNFWDRLFTQKNKIRFVCYISAAIIKRNKDKIMMLDAGGIMEWAQELQNKMNEIDINDIVQLAMQIQKKYNKYEKNNISLKG